MKILLKYVDFFNGLTYNGKTQRQRGESGMIRKRIVFWDMDSVIRLAEIISRYSYEAELMCGETTVNARSLLDVVAAYRFQGAELCIYSDSCEDLLKELDLYMERKKKKKQPVTCG